VKTIEALCEKDPINPIVYLYHSMRLCPSLSCNGLIPLFIRDPIKTLNHYLEQVVANLISQKDLPIALFVIGVACKTEIIQELIEREQYAEAVICVASFRKDWEEVGHQLITIGKEIPTFQFFECGSRDWITLGNQFLSLRRFTTILNCFVLNGDPRLIFTVAKDIKDQHLTKAKLYCAHLWKTNNFQRQILNLLCESKDFLPLVMSFLHSQL
jgi:hypothetical protein